MRDDLLIVIPAPLRTPRFPRKALRNLNGQPLLSRMVAIAADAVVDRAQIVVLTDDDEVALLAERLGCRSVLAVTGSAGSSPPMEENVQRAILEAERAAGRSYEVVALLNASSPLIRSTDLQGAVSWLLGRGQDTVLSACEDAHRTWIGVSGGYVPTLGIPSLGSPSAQPLYRETGSFAISRRDAISRNRFIGKQVGMWTIPGQRAIDIDSPHEWWICERMLQRKKLVFVVIGYPAVGLGHVYRSSAIAHELTDHEALFVCPRGSDLAADQLTRDDFSVYRQDSAGLAETILALEPDVVLNETLDTGSDYVAALKDAGVKVVTFEDLGPGAEMADLVINCIYEEKDPPSNRLVGPDYFCIRDEFLQACPRPFRDTVREVLITFGGTDALDLTCRVARIVLPIALQEGVHVSIVTGPGYGHLEHLREFLARVPPDHVELANGTKRMSEYMERADLAFSSAGRTVFELAAMRVPGIIIASSQREQSHTFASEKNGMRYLGHADAVSDGQIEHEFLALLHSPSGRRELRERTRQWDFRGGKHRVVEAIKSLLSANTMGRAGGEYAALPDEGSSEATI